MTPDHRFPGLSARRARSGIASKWEKTRRLSCHTHLPFVPGPLAVAGVVSQTEPRCDDRPSMAQRRGIRRLSPCLEPPDVVSAFWRMTGVIPQTEPHCGDRPSLAQRRGTGRLPPPFDGAVVVFPDRAAPRGLPGPGTGFTGMAFPGRCPVCRHVAVPHPGPGIGAEYQWVLQYVQKYAAPPHWRNNEFACTQ
jgi:hypothetical protein